MDENIESHVDRLLHDAERAHGGIVMAQMMGDGKSARELREKRDRLLAEALAVDPQRQAASWDEDGGYGPARGGYQ